MELPTVYKYLSPPHLATRSDLCLESSAGRRLIHKWYKGSSDRCIHLCFSTHLFIVLWSRPTLGLLLQLLRTLQVLITSFLASRVRLSIGRSNSVICLARNSWEEWPLSCGARYGSLS
ncbi:hypothetical protein BDW42DRAFT_44264 [Aspergillus taichungensis]|uniref:Uncharacterized protein n=1 Tax=Aspergillus taichungensis TaxID=482145 RepID=A0A2J5I3A8_9EURO|nr:hypothetical protein BDW42DRAFT_44264 [Aspergillus taichungensis]